MKIFHITANEGESGYILVARTKNDATRILKKWYLDCNGQSIGKLDICEAKDIQEGIIGYIDWTEPESPIFSDDY